MCNSSDRNVLKEIEETDKVIDLRKRESVRSRVEVTPNGRSPDLVNSTSHIPNQSRGLPLATGGPRHPI